MDHLLKDKVRKFLLFLTKEQEVPEHIKEGAKVLYAATGKGFTRIKGCYIPNEYLRFIAKNIEEGKDNNLRSGIVMNLIGQYDKSLCKSKEIADEIIKFVGLLIKV